MINKKKIIMIAEAGVNHNGSLKNAIKLIDIAAACKADYIKFQHTNPNLISSKAKLNSNQKKNINKKINQKEFTQSFHLNWQEAYPVLINRAKKKKIKFLTSVFSSKDYDEVKKYNLKFIKIASGEIVNYPLLNRVAQTKDTVFLSTGCSKMEEIKNAIRILRKYYSRKKIYLLHCVSSYPVPSDEINLKSIGYLRKKTNCDIGYSDHGMGVNHIFASIGMGVKVIEKHFTLNKSFDGPDHKISLNPTELKNLVKNIRKIELSLGKENKIIQKSEKKNINSIRQSIHASSFIKKGEILTENNICLMRPNNGINSMQYPKLINKIIAEKNYFIEDPIKSIDFKKKKNIKFL